MRALQSSLAGAAFQALFALLGSPIIAVWFSSSVLADDGLPQPPYLVVGTHHVLIGVVWNEDAVRRVLPPWVRPVPGMTGLINIYQADGGYGITPYQSVYFSVDVEGFDSASGIKGRWILQGAYGPEEVTSAALRTYLQLPVRNDTSRFERTAGAIRAIGSVEGRDVVVAEIKPSGKPCQPASIAVNYPSRKGLIEIPVTGESCEAEPVSVDVVAPDGDDFAAFRPVKLLWASEFRNGAFSIARPLPY